MLSLNQEILEYMAENLMHCMKPMLALPQLIQHGLLTEKDVGQSNMMFCILIMHSTN